jgi:hypothetical protein
VTVQGSNVFPIGIKKRPHPAQVAVQQPCEDLSSPAGWTGRPIGQLLFEFYPGGSAGIDCDLPEECVTQAIRALESALDQLRANQDSASYKLVST